MAEEDLILADGGEQEQEDVTFIQLIDPIETIDNSLGVLATLSELPELYSPYPDFSDDKEKTVIRCMKIIYSAQKIILKQLKEL